MQAVNSTIVDDTDIAIQYSDGWISDLQNSISPNIGAIGDPIYGTLHGAITSKSSFTYIFNGGFTGTIVVTGTYTRIPTSWTCTLDGTRMSDSTSTWNGLSVDANRQTACYATDLTLSDGQHEISVSVNGTKDNPIWFDFIYFTPSTNSVSTSFGDTQVDWTSHQIRYSDGWWGDLDNKQSGTTGFLDGATLDFDFYGKSITWFGYANTSRFDDSVRGTYSVDGEPPIEFTYRKPTVNLVNGPQTISNQVFFQTKQYPSGKHSLRVINKSSTTPLSLLNILIQNSTLDFALSPVPPLQSQTSPTDTSSISSLPSSSPGNRQEQGRPLGAIIGGCVAALAIISCLVCFLLFQRSKKRRRAQNNMTGAHGYTYGLPGARDDEEKTRQEPAHSPVSDPTDASPSISPQPISFPTSVQEHSLPRETVVVHQDSGIRYPHAFDQPESSATDNPPQYNDTMKMP
ncbi:hypothetical protein JR316_0011905 [Psilocybe cubensis]|uniref:Uncharacterized protein n=2 Tax=Psilocybe cubensis TaxID=181762 RepID=A0ACB8GMT0_PSICU|nr:hypothetical protein JR316_0011905 [Psilocybe cubensis]KAH9476330.1 hypothetical protein JR316_0011905 [Psilocybe cubensis]